jgi:membrane-associated protease RseP (regulator of RpoE activity)
VKNPKILIHAGLFVATFFTTTVAGVEWLNVDPFDLTNFHLGIPFSLSILAVLTCHEFGHYFAARYHRVEATLPYYIPFPNIAGMLNFGTLGAVIRTKSAMPSRKAMFDIGVAGPIAGFVVSLGLLVYGFQTLPGVEFILRIHPNYFQQTASDGLALTFGNSIIYRSLAYLFTDPAHQFVPPMSEMYHYHFLLAGWFGVFVTAMNLLPVGQLDGGHISFAMFGGRHALISRVSFGIVLTFGLVGALPLLGVNFPYGWTGWFFWALVLFFVIKLDHPPVEDDTPLDSTRMMIGWIAALILILSFIPTPFSISF